MCAPFSPENVQAGAVKGLTMSCLRRGVGGDRDPQEVKDGKKATPNTTLACQHQNDFYIKMGSEESHFNASLTLSLPRCHLKTTNKSRKF